MWDSAIELSNELGVFGGWRCDDDGGGVWRFEYVGYEIIVYIVDVNVIYIASNWWI